MSAPPDPRRLDLAGFEAELDRYDALVARADLVDRYCSSSYWILPALAAFHEDAEPLILAGSQGYAPLAISDVSWGRIGSPLEASWGLAAPLVSEDPPALAAEIWPALYDEPWRALVLTGLDQHDPALRTLAGLALSSGLEAGIGPASTRMVASLEGGLDGFLARRSGRFRRALLREQRRASAITIEDANAHDEPTAAALYERILAVERLSWKGRDEVGIQSGSMRVFYGAAMPRLARRGALRVAFARKDERDVGYILGGVLADTYRGLQLSYHADHADLAIGKLLQLHTITQLCEAGVNHYDLGMAMPYKTRWAEQAIETVGLVIRRGE